ncbi:glycosyltransferase family 4 protein [Blastopirellula retiformator]|uniref:GDP-mannose-dependent alpha-(1-6)-phosphatidylinositol monomannoside mannosyltransferase n=1 Tax=Blastopirellula retiformator TaxID=2527970 RepID=A0A5C5V7W8_9BACT|nr:glycosyltransferase family 4 protein [Blastopirellula retiformator]TWT34636.1 GDP-mannose-dependent alpha-(1-6)-phosphatidylinositol monomannoside mannosyltransferase [Blastopirellula retiformator]
MDHPQHETQPLKVLHVYSGNMYGGIETVLSTLAQNRVAAPQMKPEFGLCFSGRLREELEEADCVVHDLGPIRISRPWTLLRARRRLVRLLRQGEYDVVVMHACWVQALLGATARRLSPVVYWGHDISYGEHWLEKWAARCRPTYVIANSEATRESIEKRLYPGTPASIARYPVLRSDGFGADDRKAIRKEFDLDDETPVIIQVGRLESYKGLHIHLEALGQLPADEPWESWVVGGPQKAEDHEYLSKLKAIVEGHGLTNRVRFLGQRSDVARILRAADLFCHPNVRAEPFGVVFIEALFAGLPVVATNIGGAKEIVTDNCGQLVAPNDVNALAKALNELVQDLALRKSLGVNGPNRATELCDVGAQILKLEKVLRSAASLEQDGLRRAPAAVTGAP